MTPRNGLGHRRAWRDQRISFSKVWINPIASMRRGTLVKPYDSVLADVSLCSILLTFWPADLAANRLKSFDSPKFRQMGRFY